MRDVLSCPLKPSCAWYSFVQLASSFYCCFVFSAFISTHSSPTNQPSQHVSAAFCNTSPATASSGSSCTGRHRSAPCGRRQYWWLHPWTTSCHSSPPYPIPHTKSFPGPKPRKGEGTGGYAGRPPQWSDGASRQREPSKDEQTQQHSSWW